MALEASPEVCARVVQNLIAAQVITGKKKAGRSSFRTGLSGAEAPDAGVNC